MFCARVERDDLRRLGLTGGGAVEVAVAEEGGGGAAALGGREGSLGAVGEAARDEFNELRGDSLYVVRRGVEEEAEAATQDEQYHCERRESGEHGPAQELVTSAHFVDIVGCCKCKA